MTDWRKYKVADLKEECKSRDIPTTGLKLKQQYIDKLEDYEAQSGEGATKDVQEQDVEMAHGEPVSSVNGDSSQPHDIKPDVSEVADEGTREENAGEGRVSDQEVIKETNIPPALQEEERRTEAHSEKEEESTPEVPPLTADAGVKDALFVPEPENVTEKLEEKRLQETVEGDHDKQQAPSEDVQRNHEESITPDQQQAPSEDLQQNDEEPVTADQAVSSPKPAVSSTPQPSQLPSDSSTPLTSQIPPSDLAEDQKNRRKRSATPIPSAEEVARKKMRLSEEANERKAQEALEQMEGATEFSKDIRMEHTDVGLPAVSAKQTDVSAAATEPPASQGSTLVPLEARKMTPSRSPSRSRSPSEDRDVPPAIHPATSSLYISRLKRPIQPQAFRSHIISKTKTRSSDDSDPITAFYLDNIKSHAFISFTSVSAASRVRSAMHGVRYPEEGSREPLFVDYVPDDKVQSWIDQETESGFGRGGSSGRRVFEVVYEDRGDGVEAIFQEVDTTKPRAPLEPSRGSRLSFERQQLGSAPAPAGVHPDRAGLVSRDDRGRDRDRPRAPAPPSGPKNASSDPGRGFKALDELFNSTTTKPKLYYKPVPPSVAADRLGMFRGLHSRYAELGRTGDEGVKRYSFEKSKDREEWVDKGPEFGHGRRGQERLVGGDRGFRGRRRGGPYRGRAMDSWRGGSAR
ncbi:SAP domain protein [Cladophialophora carrionii]|uniref:SAP domain protein n=1 Tax=Cladophialophora carrionii TaxID=86049 RepID=A0A1C1CPD2_9EURO|nr:SAP domain protein [Cladophialophora carrionii]